MQNHHTELVNEASPNFSTVIFPLLLEWGLKLDKMKKWSLFWFHFKGFPITYTSKLSCRSAKKIIKITARPPLALAFQG